MKTNETIKTILARRSVRSFTDEPIAREDLEAIVACGPWAPSGMNRQEWMFTVVPDRKRIAVLASVIGEVLGREGYDMYCPAAIVIVSHVKESPWGKQDDSCAMENMMLAATSLGIGSVWINQLEGICDDARIRAQLDAFDIPEITRSTALRPLAMRPMTSAFLFVKTSSDGWNNASRSL